MKAVIIDDDIQFANKLETVIQQLNLIYLEIDINQFDREYELYFLDIDMPELDGISYAKEIKNQYPSSRIVFVSNRSDLVFDAIHVFPFSFIRKDKMEEELPMVLRKLNEILNEHQRTLAVNQLDLPIYRVYYIEKKGSYTYIHTKESVYKKRCSLNEIMASLNHHFIYINKGTIVNMKYVSSYNKEEIILTDFTKLYMSRGRRNEFIISFIRYKEEM